LTTYDAVSAYEAVEEFIEKLELDTFIDDVCETKT
jgi:hypothetical protein